MFRISSARLTGAGGSATSGRGLRGGSATYSGSSGSWRTSSDKNTGHHGASG